VGPEITSSRCFSVRTRGCWLRNKSIPLLAIRASHWPPGSGRAVSPAANSNPSQRTCLRRAGEFFPQRFPTFAKSQRRRAARRLKFGTTSVSVFCSARFAATALTRGNVVSVLMRWDRGGHFEDFEKETFTRFLFPQGQFWAPGLTVWGVRNFCEAWIGNRTAIGIPAGFVRS